MSFSERTRNGSQQGLLNIHPPPPHPHAVQKLLTFFQQKILAKSEINL